jgi:hypothetical protein
MAQQQIEGYVRCDAVHSRVEWRIEVVEGHPPLAVLIAETMDGDVQFLLDEQSARDAIAALQQFLAQSP